MQDKNPQLQEATDGAKNDGGGSGHAEEKNLQKDDNASQSGKSTSEKLLEQEDEVTSSFEDDEEPPPAKDDGEVEVTQVIPAPGTDVVKEKFTATEGNDLEVLSKASEAVQNLESTTVADENNNVVDPPPNNDDDSKNVDPPTANKGDDSVFTVAPSNKKEKNGSKKDSEPFDVDIFRKGDRNGTICFASSDSNEAPLSHKYISNFKNTEIKLYRCIRPDLYEKIAGYFGDDWEYYTAISDKNQYKGCPFVLGQYIFKPFADENLDDLFIFCGVVTVGPKLFYIVYNLQIGEEAKGYFISLGSRASLKFKDYVLCSVDEAQKLRNDLLSQLRIKDGVESLFRRDLPKSANNMRAQWDSWKVQHKKSKGKSKQLTTKEKNKLKYQKRKEKEKKEAEGRKNGKILIL